jgi:hypothetical protein
MTLAIVYFYDKQSVRLALSLKKTVTHILFVYLLYKNFPRRFSLNFRIATLNRMF